MLSQDDWNRLQQLFHAACALPIPERDAFAQAQAGEEPELLRELLAMLEVEEAATEAVRKPLREVATSLPIASELPASTRFGPWQVERLIGKGGMGQVYLGQRADGAYELKVAIKVIGTQQSDSQRRAYFEFERQLLAQMQHPAIAQILDAGSDEHGRLYLVMEYVEGQSLTHWCSEHKLSLRERVKLLIRVTEGVQHAHQKGVIHRDLKPGNILISNVAGEPVPKIIDFGIAARTSDEGTQAMLVAAGTPGYRAPNKSLRTWTWTAAAMSIRSAPSCSNWYRANARAAPEPRVTAATTPCVLRIGSRPCHRKKCRIWRPSCAPLRKDSGACCAMIWTGSWRAPPNRIAACATRVPRRFPMISSAGSMAIRPKPRRIGGGAR